MNELVVIAINEHYVVLERKFKLYVNDVKVQSQKFLLSP